ncbi:MAG: iron ABC transporter permease [Planctomycetota bacterium]|nr:MAG: iron ABC transporter permease [Planctomycetota bacterium]
MALTLRRWLAWVLLFVILSVAGIFLSLLVGTGFSVWESWKAIWGKGGAVDVVMGVRLERVFLGFLAGGALSIAGLLLQTSLRNPLAEPYLLGLSSGAAVGVTVAALLDAALLARSSAAFCGALLSVAALLAIAKRLSFFPPAVILAGVALNAALSAAVLLTVALLKTPYLRETVYFLMGTLRRPPEPHWLALLSSGAAAAVVFSILRGPALNLLLLGDATAASAGANPHHLRTTAIALASLAAAFSVSLCGLIGFVGLVVPHIMRLLLGGDVRLLAVASFAGGGLFLCGCDTASRALESAIPQLAIPVGVLTAIVGAPTLILLLLRSWRKMR